MRCRWVPAWGASNRTKGLFCLTVKMAVFIVKIRSGTKGACMNHKYLHAVNVWTKELQGQQNTKTLLLLLLSRFSRVRLCATL